MTTEINQMNERYRFERQIALENCCNFYPVTFASEKQKKDFLRFVTIVII